MNESLAKAVSKSIEETYVGEYSPQQECFNICTLKEMLNNNRQMFINNSFSGYIPLCMGSEAAVHNELDKLREKYGRPRP